MPHAPREELALSRLVDALVVGGKGREAALLVQKDARDAVVVLEDMLPIILLAEPEGATPGDRVTERITRAVATERKEVRLGLTDRVITVVLVGGEAPLATFHDRLPRRYEPLHAPLAYIRLPLPRVAPDRGETAEALGGDLPLDAEDAAATRKTVTKVAEAIEAARSDAGGRPALGAQALAEAEHAGEHAVAAEGLFARFTGNPFSPLVLGLFAAQLALFGFEELCGGADSTAVLARLGAAWGAAVQGGERWRLVTAGWLHFGAGHLVANGIGLLIFLPIVRAALGPARAFVLYAWSCTAGFALATWGAPEQFGGGASGGVLGLMAALLVLSIRRTELVPRTSRLGLGGLAALYLGYNLVGSLKPGVSLLGHLGGALAGAALAGSGAISLGLPPLDAGREEAALSRLAARLVAAGTAAVTVLAFAIALAGGRPWEVRWPPPPSTIRIPGTTFQIDLPKDLAAQIEEKEGAFFRLVRFGRREIDPILVSLILRERAPIAPGDEAKAADAILARLVISGPGKDYRLLAPPRIVQLDPARPGGRPAVYLDQVLDEDGGGLRPRWVFADGDREIDVQIALGPDANFRWAELAERSVRSITRTFEKK